jgi:hypothetical protein
MAFIVFDIETRVDKALVNRVYHAADGLSDDEAYERHRAELMRRRSSDFFPIPFHVPISIALAEIADDHALRGIESLGAGASSEEALVGDFWSRIDRSPATLVTFNGRRFDLPVLELAALRCGVSAPNYFSDASRARNRYAEDRHLDLLDFLTNHGAVTLAGGLNLLLNMLGLPGKTGVNGSQVQQLYESGRIDEIHRYCRDDVMRTYLLFLRVELLRGRISESRCRALIDASCRTLAGASGERS